ncbi:unnamed protein product [Clonostachys rosea]|uniref:1-alkyl-2-acetylglycerophosphocholine esterase n=1 Tax=Bionectria ochroleuca TaxID=29856 RepID=A0ABY6V0Y2_BIOOC|nr:unnamed protein product [Clonostachys rosea]
MMRGAALVGAIASALISLAQGILLPSPPGPYDVTLRTTELNDFSRNETYASGADHRRIMVSVFSPIPKGSESCESIYMPDAVANYEMKYYSSLPAPANITLDIKQFKQQVCSVDVTHGKPHQNLDRQAVHNTTSFPLIFFSPGHGGPRFWYHFMLQHFASYGYIVVLMDHPGDSHIVEFPDGSTILYSPDTSATEDAIERNLLVRTADASFTLDQLSFNCTLRHLVFSSHVRAESFERVGIWGHSFGGDTAVSANLEDKRFSGAINLDGYLYGRVQKDGFDRPALFIEDDDGLTSPHWIATWPLIRGYRQMLRLKGTLHYGLMDDRLLADLAGVDAPTLGSIDGLTLIETFTAYARDFFEFALHGQGLGLLEGPSPEYPQVVFDEPREDQ